jgi:DNA-binding SARP family transcriptional activator
VKSAFLRLPSLVAAIVGLGAVAALARFRPEFPETPDSLSAPVTTAFLQELAIVGAWLLAALLVLLLLVQSLRDIWSRNQELGRPDLPPRTREPSSFGRLPRMPGHLHPLIDEPRLMVVAVPEAQPAPLGEQSDKSANKPAARAAAESDSRPFISLLGPLTIDGGKSSRKGLRAAALELIAFLALRQEGAQRDEILEALWPGTDPERSRHRLYQAVRDARRLLDEAIASERDRYWLDRDRVRIDVDELAELVDETDRLPMGKSMDELLERALALFRGEPLAECDYVWSGGERRRLSAIHVGLLKRVGRARLARGDAQASLGAAERGLALDALDEELWRLALQAEGALGLREAIEDRYGRLRDLLRERLAIEPTAETRALYFRLLGQN